MLRKIMYILASAASIALAQTATAASAQAPWQGGSDEVDTPASNGPAVDHITVFNIDGWRPVGRDAIILWTSPSKPYLLKLDRPAMDLPYVEHVGLTSTGSELYAGFDSVIVRGWRYRIASIHPLTRDLARSLRSAAQVS
jgi:Family of unknown function (DUF6491)